MAEDANRRKGEFVLLIEGAQTQMDKTDTEAKRILSILLDQLPPSSAAALAAKITGTKKTSCMNSLWNLKILPPTKKPVDKNYRKNGFSNIFIIPERHSRSLKNPQANIDIFFTQIFQPIPAKW